MAKTKSVKELLQILKSVSKHRELPDFEDEFLSYEIERAIGEINRCRRFTPKEDVLYDVKYEYLIVPMCISSLAKIGAEGETRHVENGVDRQYGTDNDYPIKLTSQIIPLIK